MSQTLSDQNKKIIFLIEAQVKQFVARKTPDRVMILILIDFIPDIRHMVISTCEKQLDLYYKEYQYFYYFLQLISKDSNDE